MTIRDIPQCSSSALLLLVAAPLWLGCPSNTPSTTTPATETSGATTDATDPTTGTGSTTTATQATDETGTTAGSTGTGDAPVGHAEFVLDGDVYEQAAYEWSNEAGNHVFCWFYGAQDYVWVRFAESPDANGDSSPHIDLDLCRFTEGGPGGSYGAMDPTKHGSQCQATPGFGVWWHEGEAAYNNDPLARDCALEVEVDGEVLRGEFHCAPLPEVDGENTLAVTEGRFSCNAVAK